jgi:hypothetical protein
MNTGSNIQLGEGTDIDVIKVDRWSTEMQRGPLGWLLRNHLLKVLNTCRRSIDESVEKNR